MPAPVPLLLTLLFAEAEPPALQVPFVRYTLPNGLRVILHEDHRLPVVVVDLWFDVGSKDERPGRTGFAHLFEHLMFMGTKNVPEGRFDLLMESAGGSNNGSTTEDRTNYYEVGPSHLLETFLWLEADRLAGLPEAMTQAKLDLQREVVKNERRQGIDNRPYGQVEVILPELLFPRGHPYAHAVIGSHQDLSAARLPDVLDFFRRYYYPANAVLVVAGALDPGETRRLVARYFGPLPARPRPPPPAAAPPPPPRAATREILDQVELERLVLAWHSPAWFAPGDAEAELLAAVLGAGKSSRLVRALVYEQAVAQEVEVLHEPRRLGGVFSIVATAQPGRRGEELERAVDQVLAELSTRPVTGDELERARAVVETRTLAALESPVEVADLLAAAELRFGDPGQLARSLLARFAAVSPEDVAWHARSLDEPRARLFVRPRKGAPR